MLLCGIASVALRCLLSIRAPHLLAWQSYCTFRCAVASGMPHNERGSGGPWWQIDLPRMLKRKPLKEKAYTERGLRFALRSTLHTSFGSSFSVGGFRGPSPVACGPEPVAAPSATRAESRRSERSMFVDFVWIMIWQEDFFILKLFFKHNFTISEPWTCTPSLQCRPACCCSCSSGRGCCRPTFWRGSAAMLVVAT